MNDLDFSDDELISYFKNSFGIRKTRERSYIDNRNYVIALLHEHFGYSENDIGCLFMIDRSSVNHAKKKAYEFLVERQDKIYASNIRELKSKFNAYITDPEERRNINHYQVGFTFTTKDWYKKLQKAAELDNKRVGEYSKKVLLDHLENLEL
jgi:hypothetical protein